MKVNMCVLTFGGKLMSIEGIILLLTTIAAAVKAYFEWRKARAEAKRADDIEDMLSHTIQSVEEAKNRLDYRTRRVFTQHMSEYIKKSDCSEVKINTVVKEVTEGPGDIRNSLEQLPPHLS